MDDFAARSTRQYSLLLASEARGGGWVGQLRSGVRRGEVVRVRPGVYLPSDVWTSLPPEGRYLVRIHAVGLTFRHPVFARESAAALHGLPLLRSRLDRVHLNQTTPSGSGKRRDVTVHASGVDPDVVRIDDLSATSVVDTVLELARTLPHPEALALADAALRPRSHGDGSDGIAGAATTRRALMDAARESLSARGGWSAYVVADAADGGSGSLGESFARSAMIRLGAPAPELQAPIWDEDGLVGYADFLWRDHGIVGEFDGRLKYGADNPSGRVPEDVVYREKLREDRIRAVTSGFFRCSWSDGHDPPRLAAMLRAAGLPLSPGRPLPLPRGVHVGSSASSRLA